VDLSSTAAHCCHWSLTVPHVGPLTLGVRQHEVASKTGKSAQHCFKPSWLEQGPESPGVAGCCHAGFWQAITSTQWPSLPGQSGWEESYYQQMAYYAEYEAYAAAAAAAAAGMPGLGNIQVSTTLLSVPACHPLGHAARCSGPSFVYNAGCLGG